MSETQQKTLAKNHMTPLIRHLVEEVNERNRIRAEFGMPLVSVHDEVRKIVNARRYAEWQHWCGTTPARGPIHDQLLAEERAKRGDLNWLPRSFHNGGAAFGSNLEKRLALWKNIEDEVIAKYQKQIGPNWLPRGMIKGFAFHSEVESIFRQRLRDGNLNSSIK